MNDPVTLAGYSEEKGNIGQAQGQETPCQLKKVVVKEHHRSTCTAIEQTDYGYFSHSAAPSGDKDSQTDSDWIHYYALMGGGVESRGETQSVFSKLQSERGNGWEIYTDHLSVGFCGHIVYLHVYAVCRCVCVCVCVIILPSGINFL